MEQWHMNNPAEPLSLFRKLLQFGITGLIVVSFWISGLWHLASLQYKYHNSELFEDLGITWFGTGFFTIIIVGGLMVISFASWTYRRYKWSMYVREVTVLRRENNEMREMLESIESRQRVKKYKRNLFS
jgi:hypothetical protein